MLLQGIKIILAIGGSVMFVLGLFHLILGLKITSRERRLKKEHKQRLQESARLTKTD